MKQQIEDLVAYHIWANNQVFTCAASLSAEQYQQETDYSKGSVAKQLFHLMQADYFTPPTVQGDLSGWGNDPNAPQEDDYTDVASLQSTWEAVGSRLQETVSAMSDEDWQRPFTMALSKEKTFTTTGWEMLMATINHGTNHRAQTLALIDKLGGETVEQGYFFYLAQRP